MMDAAYPIGFIGLGTMGEAMALTLVNAGTRLLVWNRTRAKAEILAAAGADVAREAADVFARSATVFLMLVDGGAIEQPLELPRNPTGTFGTEINGRPDGDAIVNSRRNPGLVEAARFESQDRPES